MATLRLARVVVPRTLDGILRSDYGAAMVHRNAMSLATAAKVLVDHDEARSVGRVTALRETRDEDGIPWLAAMAVIDQPPPWLRVGTAVSMCWAQDLNVDHWIGRCEIVDDGEIREISLVSPGKRPGVRDAQVIELTPLPAPAAAAKPKQPPPAKVVQSRIAAPPVRRTARHDEEIAELNRRLDWLGPHPTQHQISAVYAGMRAECSPPSIDSVYREVFAP